MPSSHRIVVFVAVLAALTGVSYALGNQDPNTKPGQPASQPATPGSEDDFDAKVSYALGQQIGRYVSQLADEGFVVDMAELQKGITERAAGTENLSMTEEACNKVIQDLNVVRRERATKRREEQGVANIEEGKKFLEANAAKEGVTVLPSGLQYKVLRDGDGESPTATDKVLAHYRGTLLDGTEFDSSYARGNPATFGVNQVIRGWQEALPLMKVGAKWELYIPSDLAYGANGQGAKIGPNAVLVFEVELLEVKH